MRVLTHPAAQIALATVAGVAFGLIVGDWATNLAFIGTIFIRLIQMAIVPLVLCSVITATASMSGSGTGRLAARTFGWMIGMSVVSAVVAYALAAAFQPGRGMTFTGTLDSSLTTSAKAAQGWKDTILGFFSTNIFESMSRGDMIPVIVFALLTGVALNRYVAASGNTLVRDVVAQAQEVILLLIRIVMYVAPVGVFCLLADVSARVGASVITSALSYLGVTALGVLILTAAFVLLVWARTGLNPLLLPGKLAEQTIIAVTTTSSAVTYPTVLRNTVEKVGVSQRVAGFTLSVGLTMGSYGAVLNYMIVVMFLAQAGGVALTPGQVALGMALAVLLNMGTITVPGGFPVVAMFLATSLGLPFQAVGLLIAVDWFTGILRTFLNVNGDTFVAMLVAQATGEINREVYGQRKSVRAARAAEEGAPAAGLSLAEAAS